MNAKRVLIATVIGALCGVFCAYGTASMEGPAAAFITTGVLAATFYNRVLIGLFVGLGDNIKLHPVARGALIGAVISLMSSIILLVDGQPEGGAVFLVFGVVYGVIADVVATKLAK